MSSFPNILYREEGAQFETYASQAAAGARLGQLMVTNGGEKKFRLCQASGTATATGNLYTTNTLAVVAGTADADILNALVVATGAAAGGNTISVTMAGTAHFSKDLLAEGYIFGSAGTVGMGYNYRIKSNTVAASLGTCAITIYGTFKAAIPASSALVGVRQNPYKNVTITVAGTDLTGPVVGVSPCIIPASNFGWIQRGGVAAVQCGGAALVQGIPCVPSATTGGAVSVMIASTTTTRKDLFIIGVAMNIPAATTGCALVDLMLE